MCETPRHTPSPGDCAFTPAPVRGRCEECSTRAGRTPACTRPTHVADHECEWKRSEMPAFHRTGLDATQPCHLRSRSPYSTRHPSGRDPPPHPNRQGTTLPLSSWPSHGRGEGVKGGRSEDIHRPPGEGDARRRVPGTAFSVTPSRSEQEENAVPGNAREEHPEKWPAIVGGGPPALRRGRSPSRLRSRPASPEEDGGAVRQHGHGRRNPEKGRGRGVPDRLHRPHTPRPLPRCHLEAPPPTHTVRG